MTNLAELRNAASTARIAMQVLVGRKFPGCTEWHWYRALSAVKGDNCRRNDDTTNDIGMVADVDIKAAHDDYIRLLHVFYSARDGQHGVLGGRGL